MLAELTIQEFMAQLGSKAATPGGGGAAALSGASAAGLVTMVARLTEGRPAFAHIEARLKAIISEGDQLRHQLLQAIDGDAAAFETVMAAYGLPRGTSEEKSARALALQPALQAATEAPLTTARACLRVAGLAAELAETANPQTITDAASAGVMAEAGLQSAVFQARINLNSIKDVEYLKTTRAEIAELLTKVAEVRGRAIATLEKNLGQ